jgi:hypothetical protein
LIGFVLVAVIVAACGTNGNSSSEGKNAERQGQSSGTTQDTEGQTPSKGKGSRKHNRKKQKDEQSSLLARHEPVPDGIPENLVFLSPNERFCPPNLSQPSVEAPTPVEIPTVTFVAVCAFPPGEHLTLKVDRPSESGQSTELTADGQGTGLATFEALPGDSIGTYTATATTDDGVTFSKAFDVTRATTPQAVAVPRQGPLTTTFTLAFGGLMAHTMVHLIETQPERRYVTALAIDPDGNGEATIAIPTQSDDPSGMYCVYAPTVKPYGCATGFVVER